MKIFDAKQKLATAVAAVALAGAIALPTMAADNMPISPNSAANNPLYQISVNGQPINGNPQIMVPLRSTAETLGYKVNYCSSGDISLIGSENSIELIIGQNAYTFVEGEKDSANTFIKCTSTTPEVLEAAPYISNNTVYVPLSLFLRNNSLDISTNDSTINININQNNQIPNPITEHNTLSDLIKAVSFEVCTPSVDQYQITRYADISNEIAEINYTDKNGNEITFRSAKISDAKQDISGDYNEYNKNYGMAVGNVVVSCRGDEKINTAFWSANGFDYSITSSIGLSEDFIKEIVLGTVK